MIKLYYLVFLNVHHKEIISLEKGESKLLSEDNQSISNLIGTAAATI